MDIQLTCGVDGCTKIYFNRSSLCRHKKIDHNLVLKQPKITCNQCENKFYYVHQLVDHIREAHQIEVNEQILNFKNEAGKFSKRSNDL